MAITMPKIDITFEQRAVSLIGRSERGVAILIVRDDTDKTFTHKQYSEIGKRVKTGWLTIAGQNAADGLALSAWVKTQANTKHKTYKAVCYNLTTAPDDMHVVNFVNESVTYTDDRGKKDGVTYLPSLLGIFAVCNVTRGCTNYECSNLSEVVEVDDNDAALGTGKFITAVFRGTYLGNYRNTRDNQMLLLSSLNMSYFRQLMQQNILDPDFANAARIDVDAQRAAWMASGKTEAESWDDDTVKANPFKRTVYLTADVKILNSMTDLIFPINLF